MLTKRQDQTTNQITKRTYSYQDLVKMQASAAYNTIGKTILSQISTAPRATFGKAEKKKEEKLLAEQKFMKKTAFGKEGQGPATYLPSRYTDQTGTQKQRPDINSQLKYNSIPSFSIGKQPRTGQKLIVYNYMNCKNDNIELNQADLKRRNSTPVIRIGTDTRFKQQRLDKVTPGPTYDPQLKPDAKQAPHYTIGVRRSIPGVDPFVSCNGTTNIVGPSTYFERSNKGSKSHSSLTLNRVPYDSKIKNAPVISFAKGPKSLASFKSSVDQTYDIKTKTIMAHYDFQYDAGKGLNSGRAWQKKHIVKSSNMPLERNKMKSFTIARSSREKQQKRGNFVSTMSQVPVSVRIQHPKF